MHRLFLALCLSTMFWLLGCDGGNNQIPSAPKTSSTPLSCASEILSLWQRDIDQYRTHTQDPQSIRPQAEEFLRAVQLNMLPRPRGPRLEDTAALGKKLLERGCQDPLVKTYYAKALSHTQGPYDAMVTVIEGLNGFCRNSYPRECQRLGVFTLFGDAKWFAQGLPWSHVRLEAAEQAALRLGDSTIDLKMRRVLFYELLPLINDTCSQNWEDAVAISEACGKLPKADPWIVHLLAGRAFVARAWHHRGGDWGYKVTRENWKLFEENLQKAAHEYAEALKLHPENPEPASLMIPVAMGLNDRQTVQEWFDKAVAAEIDYMPAYDNLRWALRPRWHGSHEIMYRWGCRCADTQRYDTNVPLVLLDVLNDIDSELGYNGEFWRRAGVYDQAKQVLEKMAQDPSRADDSSALAGKSRLQTIHAIVAERAGQCADARRLVDQLGSRLDRDILSRWCSHPEWELTRIYAFSGRAADDLRKAWSTLMAAPSPISQAALEQAKGLYQKALKADDNERSRAFAQSWLDEVEGYRAFNVGKWYEKKFSPNCLTWAISGTTWTTESPRVAVGHVRRTTGRVFVSPSFTPPFPLEVEFDVEMPVLQRFPVNLGLFLSDQQAPECDADWRFQRFFVCPQRKQAGMQIGSKTELVSCKLKPVNRLRVQLADGFAALYVNDHFCLEHRDKEFHPLPAFYFGCHTYLTSNMLVRVGNVRFRRWDPSSSKKPLHAETAEKKVKEEKQGEKEKTREESEKKGEKESRKSF
ncbi:MAG: hypothetical protein ABFC77_10100 [Thermoguttaceae bacterium]